MNIIDSFRHKKRIRLKDVPIGRPFLLISDAYFYLKMADNVNYVRINDGRLFQIEDNEQLVLVTEKEIY